MSFDSPSDFYPMVPKGRMENLAFRRRVHTACLNSRQTRNTVREACRRDVLFFLNVFGYTFYPHLETGTMPLITFGYQDRAILGIRAALGKRDQLIEKSRETGGSLVPEWVFYHAAMFESDLTFLMGSRKEDLVDDSSNPDSLFWKLDFMNRHMPGWLLGEVDRASMRMLFRRTGSIINGESTNPGFARGGRRTAILLDEFAHVECDREVEESTLRATACRIYVSTPRGSSNVFAEKARTMDREQVYRFHWSEHPDFGRGLYYDEKGQPRSPWYDEQCKRTHPRVIAQELDIDYIGSTTSFFSRDLVDRLLGETVLEPFAEGFLEGKESLVKSRLVEGGPVKDLKLWINLENGVPPRDLEYGIGVDVATGSVDAKGRGYSVSAAVVGDLRKGEMVAELAVSGVMPHDFAEMVYRLAMFFSGLDGTAGPLVIWEAMGPGATFGQTLMDLGYRNVYYHRDDRKYFSGEKGEVPGFWPSKSSKKTLFGAYLRDLSEGNFVNRSRDSMEEHRMWVFSAAGDVVHAVASETDDPTGARENHGDRVVAAALLNRIMRIAKVEKKVPDKYPKGTFGHLVQRMLGAKREPRWVI